MDRFDPAASDELEDEGFGEGEDMLLDLSSLPLVGVDMQAGGELLLLLTTVAAVATGEGETP